MLFSCYIQNYHLYIKIKSVGCCIYGRKAVQSLKVNISLVYDIRFGNSRIIYRMIMLLISTPKTSFFKKNTKKTTFHLRGTCPF